MVLILTSISITEVHFFHSCLVKSSSCLWNLRHFT